MLRDEGIETETTWTGGGKRLDWQQIDRSLRELATRRGALDHEEAQLLCIAHRGEIWRELGKATFLEYLEEVLGYGPRAAHDRVRVALALEDLPELAEALATGELAYSAIRELTRVATPMTDREWCDDARGKNLREIEQRVTGRKKGDRPTDPADLDLRPRVVRFEVRAATLALLRQAQQVLAEERGTQLDDDALIAALCNAVLDGGGGADDSGRAKFQIMTLVCEGCAQGWQDAAGRRIAIEPADLSRAECDAQRIGSIDAPARATQDVSPATQRYVRRRDGGRCCVPGCRSARHLELHHVVPRAAGGGHTADNLTLLCDGHHAALHDGKLTITGKAPALDVQWTNPRPIAGAPLGAVQRIAGAPVGAAGPFACASVGAVQPTRLEPTEMTGPGAARSTQPSIEGDHRLIADAHVSVAKPSRFERVVLATQVRQALVKMGFSPTEAREALAATESSIGPNPTIQRLVFEALRRCPKPR